MTVDDDDDDDDFELGPGIMYVQGVVVSCPSLVNRVNELLQTGGDLDHSGHLKLGGFGQVQENPKNLTLLHLAVAVKHGAMVRKLLEGGADPHKKDKENQTPLVYAIMAGYEDAVWLLLAAEAKIRDEDIHGPPPLYEAARDGLLGVVRKLLTAGANVNQMTKIGPALHGAAANGHAAIVQVLLENGADVDLTDDLGNTALHMAVQGGWGWHRPIDRSVLSVLIEWRANVNAKTDEGTFPLHLAAKYGDVQIGRALLDAGADLDKRHDSKKHPGGATPLIIAACHGKDAFARMLMAAGAKLDCLDNDGISALKAAVMNRRESCVDLLTSHMSSNSPKSNLCTYCGSSNAKLSRCSWQERLFTALVKSLAQLSVFISHHVLIFSPPTNQ